VSLLSTTVVDKLALNIQRAPLIKSEEIAVSSIFD
jgi:hypothetical protein